MEDKDHDDSKEHFIHLINGHIEMYSQLLEGMKNVKTADLPLITFHHGCKEALHGLSLMQLILDHPDVKVKTKDQCKNPDCNIHSAKH